MEFVLRSRRPPARGRANSIARIRLGANEEWHARARESLYELLSICARNSAIEPNLTVPCGSLASIDPSA
jgi:hypothetical protein